MYISNQRSIIINVRQVLTKIKQFLDEKEKTEYGKENN